MSEKKHFKREWIKTAAIVFLSVMLVLTFFSNTIMNYSLPVVATQYVENGSITSKVRGSGIIEATDPFNVKLKGEGITRTISSILVRTGDFVNEGDTLMLFAEVDDTSDAELQAAKDAYNKAIREIEMAVLSGNLTLEGKKEIENGNTTSYSANLRKIADLNDKIAAKQAEVDQYNAYLKSLQNNSTINGAGDPEKVEELKIAYENAKSNLDDFDEMMKKDWNALAQEALDKLNDHLAGDSFDDYMAARNFAIGSKENDYEKALNNYSIYYKAWENDPTAEREGLKDTAAANLATAKSDLDGVKEEIEKRDKANQLKEKYDECSMIANKSQDDIKKERDNLEKKKTDAYNLWQAAAGKVSVDQTIVTLPTTIAQLESELKDLQQAKTDLLAEITTKMNFADTLKPLKENLDRLQAKYDKAVEEGTAGGVTAPISGTVQSIDVRSGDEISSGQVVATIQEAGKTYTMSFSVPNEQAKMISIGDRADIINSWYYNNMDVTVASIRPDKMNPGKSKTITLDITGDVVPGQNLSVSIGQRSAQYDTVVPNSALREDNNGKFVLIVESKSSPLGNRYMAVRYDVQVVASDDTKSAVTGALSGWEFVITTSTKPVEPGQQVRLTDNQ